MKELSYEEALRILEKGKVAVQCQLSNREDDTTVVRDVSRMKYLNNLKEEGIYKVFKIFPIRQKKERTPKDALELSFDEAYAAVARGELVFYKDDGEEEEVNSTATLVSVRRSFDMRGKTLLLYWYD